jgi:ribonuclease D
VPDTQPHPLDYLDTADAVARFAESIADVRELAIDTEGASFHRFVDRVYLLQLSTRDRSAIVDPLPIGTPEGLGRLVESPDVEVVFHDADYDLRLLHQDYGWKVRNVFDTRIAAQLLGFKAFGLAALLERYFDVKLDKQHQRADWSQRPLTRGMLDYAAQDTRWLLELRDLLRDELAAKGRLGWAKEEFERLESVRWDADETGLAFLRMKGARDLNRRELAVLGQVVAWRDDVARALDRATFRVIGNEALFALARQQPRDRDGLLAVKGMPRGILEQRGQEILAAIERGLAIPEAELPRFPRAPRWDRDPDFDDRVSRLRAVRDRAAERLELDPGVLCSRDRLETIARQQPQTLDALRDLKLLRNWQVEELGAELIGALGGGGVTVPVENVVEESPYRD